jgi:PAS domain S-box-containing protein
VAVGRSGTRQGGICSRSSGSASLRFALIILALVSSGAMAQTTVERPRTIRVVTDNVYAPYSFQTEEGELQGIVIDQWQAWEKKTGIKVEIQAMDWGEAVRRMRAGEFDVIDTIVETAERRDYFDFTPAYTPIEASIFFRNDISGITDLASLKGFPVGVKAGDQHIDQLKANGVTTMILFKNNDEIIAAAKQRKINVFVVDDPSALYLLNKAGIEGEFRHSAPMFQDELRRAVRKGNTALLREVSEGFAGIDPDELKQINERWRGQPISRIRQYLIYAGYTVAAALLIIAGLAAWNRSLRQRVLERTAALSESEQRFRRLVELMPVAVYVCDTSGVIQSYNHRAVELWGREPKVGDTAQRYCASLRLYSPDGTLVPHEESKMAEVLRTGVHARDLEVVIEQPDGSCLTVLVNIAPLRNGEGELIGAMNCFQDITERKQAAKELEEMNQRLRVLSQRLFQIQEEERRHLARELHDEIGQALTAAKINTEMLRATVPSDLGGRLDENAAILDRLLQQTRQISLDLRPPLLDDLGLVPALRWYVDQQAKRAGLEAEFSADPLADDAPPHLQIVCFRLAQEAITNVVRHADARTLRVELRRADTSLRLLVRDDGKGFDVAAAKARAEQGASLGLLGLNERAVLASGSARITSSPGEGATVEILLPLASAESTMGTQTTGETKSGGE